MALLAALTTWSAGDKLTATALNDEFLNLLDALNGSDDDNVKIKMNTAALPTLQLINSHASGYGLQAGDGTNNDLFGVKSTGVIESKVATGTAPLIVASTTVVSNLNADLVDGIEGTAFVKNNTTGQSIEPASGDLAFGLWGATPGDTAELRLGSGTPASDDYWYIQSTAAAGKFSISRYGGGGADEGEYLGINASGANVIVNIGSAAFAPPSNSLVMHNDAGQTYTWTFASTALTLSFFGGFTSVDLLQIDGTNNDVIIKKGLKLEGNNSATIQTLTDAASITWDADDGSAAKVTITANRTLANISNPAVGASYTLIVKQDGTGGHTLSFGSYYKFSGGVAPTISTGANAVDVLTIFVEDATTFYVTAVQNML